MPISAYRALGWALALAALSGSASGSALAQHPPEAEARALEERLRAPCCRGQMLVAHESDATHALRQEIRARLTAGEAPPALEADFVRRFGASIVAVPRDRDPRGGLSLALAAGLALSATWLSLRALRWVRRNRVASEQLAPGAAQGASGQFEAALDAELRAWDR
jgi:cytochrome c-type biogenesis protein CcmH